MKYLLKTGSFLGLGLTVVPAFLVFAGRLTWDTHALLMGVGALLWFATAPFWMVKEEAAHDGMQGEDGASKGRSGWGGSSPQ